MSAPALVSEKAQEGKKKKKTLTEMEKTDNEL